jgi:hypothetical protein
MRLKQRQRGKLRIIEDPDATRCMILHGLYNGLQNSVIRGSTFKAMRFEAASRNEAEDQLVVIRCLVNGHTMAFIDQVHVIYRIHESNSSGSAINQEVSKRIRLLKELIAGYERLGTELTLSCRETLALRKRLSRVYFWQLGYSVLLANGLRSDAMHAFRRGLHQWPWDWRCWKTYFLCALRSVPE